MGRHDRVLGCGGCVGQVLVLQVLAGQALHWVCNLPGNLHLAHCLV